MILKLSFVITLLLSTNLFAINVIVAKSAMNFEEKIDTKKLRLVNVATIKKSCIPLTLKDIQNNEYITTHYINRNSILCQKDVKTYKDNSVLFNFGSIQIEKKGKVVFENDKLIRIKNENGKIEEIYKDGRLK